MGLVQQLAPRGRLVIPVGSSNSVDRGESKVYRKYWLVEKGPDGAVQFNGRAGPISVNFVPFLPSSNKKAQPPDTLAKHHVPTQPAVLGVPVPLFQPRLVEQ